MYDNIRLSITLFGYIGSLHSRNINFWFRHFGPVISASAFYSCYIGPTAFSVCYISLILRRYDYAGIKKNIENL